MPPDLLSPYDNRVLQKRSCAWVSGLDGRAESLSSSDGRRGAASRKGEKRGSARSSDGGAIDIDEQCSKWISNGRCGGARWCADRVNPNAPPCGPPFIPRCQNPRPLWALPTVWAVAGPLFSSLACAARLCGSEWVLVAGPVSFKETGPLLLLSLLFYISSFISL
jgi:hypothetical protein